mmetsp:Transcript_60524/g.132497  ORF Transcript_60524/g.132497 Transcript_60524/m.132497 type:complete len:81 (+) Transcript_60524:759-1001(+)
MDIKKLEKYRRGCNFTFGMVSQRRTPPGESRTCFHACRKGWLFWLFFSRNGDERSGSADTCLAIADGEVMIPSAKDSVPS